MGEHDLVADRDGDHLIERAEVQRPGGRRARPIDRSDRRVWRGRRVVGEAADHGTDAEGADPDRGREQQRRTPAGGEAATQREPPLQLRSRDRERLGVPIVTERGAEPALDQFVMHG
jgi:hypothetical protein